MVATIFWALCEHHPLSSQDILATHTVDGEILHHLKHPGIMIPCKYGFPWIQILGPPVVPFYPVLVGRGSPY